MLKNYILCYFKLNKFKKWYNTIITIIVMADNDININLMYDFTEAATDDDDYGEDNVDHNNGSKW